MACSSSAARDVSFFFFFYIRRYVRRLSIFNRILRRSAFAVDERSVLRKKFFRIHLSAIGINLNQFNKRFLITKLVISYLRQGLRRRQDAMTLRSRLERRTKERGTGRTEILTREIFRERGKRTNAFAHAQTDRGSIVVFGVTRRLPRGLAVQTSVRNPIRN